MLALLLALASATSARAEMLSAQGRAKAMRALVRLSAYGCAGRESGGELSHGFLVRGDDGKLYVVATLHGVAACKQVELQLPQRAQLEGPQWMTEKSVQGTKIRFRTSADLALIPLDVSDLPVHADGSKPTPLEWRKAPPAAAVKGTVFAVGYHDDATTLSDMPLVVREPESHEMKHIIGTKVASELADSKMHGLVDVRVVLLDGNLSPGSSGMAVVDPDGNLVGIAQGGLDLGRKGTAWAIEAPEVGELFKSHDTALTSKDVSRLAALGLFAREDLVLGPLYAPHTLVGLQAGAGLYDIGSARRGGMLEVALESFFETTTFEALLPRHCLGFGFMLAYDMRSTDRRFTAPDGNLLEKDRLHWQGGHVEGLIGLRINRLSRFPIQVETGLRAGLSGFGLDGGEQFWWGIPLHLRVDYASRAWFVPGVGISFLLDSFPSDEQQYSFEGTATLRSERTYTPSIQLRLFLDWEISP